MMGQEKNLILFKLLSPENSRKREHKIFSYRFSHEATNQLLLDFRLNLILFTEEETGRLDFSGG